MKHGQEDWTDRERKMGVHNVMVNDTSYGIC